MKSKITGAFAAIAMLMGGTTANAAHVYSNFDVVSGDVDVVTNNCLYSFATCTNIGGAFLESEKTFALVTREGDYQGYHYTARDWADILVYARNSGSGVDETFYLGFTIDDVLYNRLFTVPAHQRSFDVYRVSIYAQSPVTFFKFAYGSDSPTGPVIGYVSTYIQAVPEPTTWAMMILGFGLSGAALRRRQDRRARLLPA